MPQTDKTVACRRVVVSRLLSSAIAWDAFGHEEHEGSASTEEVQLLERFPYHPYILVIRRHLVLSKVFGQQCLAILLDLVFHLAKRRNGPIWPRSGCYATADAG